MKQLLLSYHETLIYEWGSNDMRYVTVAEINALLGNDHRSTPELIARCDATTRFVLVYRAMFLCVVIAFQPAVAFRILRQNVKPGDCSSSTQRPLTFLRPELLHIPLIRKSGSESAKQRHIEIGHKQKATDSYAINTSRHVEFRNEQCAILKMVKLAFHVEQKLLLTEKRHNSFRPTAFRVGTVNRTNKLRGL
jgi:hypothetical protein